MAGRSGMAGFGTGSGRDSEDEDEEVEVEEPPREAGAETLPYLCTKIFVIFKQYVFKPPPSHKPLIYPPHALY